jgi:putative DNA primase/helicase
MEDHAEQAVLTLATIEALHKLGLDFITYERGLKGPRIKEWQLKPKKTIEQLRSAGNCNFGIRLGGWSKIGDRVLVALDVDIKTPAAVAPCHAWLDEFVPEWRSLPSVISGSGGHSRHIYGTFAKSPTKTRIVMGSGDGWNVDVRGNESGKGCQNVWAGSLHPDGGLYTFERPFDVGRIERALIEAAEDMIGCDFPTGLEFNDEFEGEVFEKIGAPRAKNDAFGDDDEDWLEREARDSTLEDFDIAKAKATFLVFPAGWWDERDTWRDAGMALHHQFEGSDAAFDLWCELSKQSTKFDQRVQRQQWNSFKPKSGGITMRSMLRAAADERAQREAAIPDDEDLIGDLPSVEKPNVGADAPAGRDPGGDYALSRAFAAKAKATMRFDRAARHFMAYSDGVGAWGRCDRGEEEQAMLDCARRRFNKACTAYRANPSDANERKQTEARGYLKNANLLTRALGMAKSHPELVCLPTDFNTDPYSFPVANGMVDLRTGKLTPPSADLMISKLSPVRFDPAATCPKFNDFMLRIMPDTEVRKFLQVAVGYTITGLVDEERLFLCHGKGANGKSVFANIIAALMGESTTGFSITVDPLTFVKGSRAGESERNVVSLIGKRLCLVNEIPQGAVWDDGKVKLLTSREQIAARHLYAENVNFWPSHTMWVRANSLPGAHDASDGFWRRVVPVPFTTQIPEAERIGDLDRQIMREELAGVLNWALAGAREYLATGRLVVPKSLSRLTAQYRESCDVFGQWLDDCVIAGEAARLPSGEAYRAYKAFCADQGVTPPAQVAFSRTMGDRGFPPAKGTGGARYFHGLKLRNGFDDYGEAAA